MYFAATPASITTQQPEDERIRFPSSGSSITPQPEDERPHIIHTPSSVTTPQPENERPRPKHESTTEIFVQPDNEVPITEQLYTCRQDGRVFQDKQKWRVNDCTECACVRGIVECITNDECLHIPGKNELQNYPNRVCICCRGNYLSSSTRYAKMMTRVSSK